MKQGLRFKVIDFCNFENSASDAEHVAEEQIFIDDDEHTAHHKLSEYLKDKVFKPYLSWTQEVYPKMQVEKIFLR